LLNPTKITGIDEDEWRARERALRDYINDRCIKRVPPNSRELTQMDEPGRFYEWQFYLRAAVLRPDHLNFIAQYFWGLYRERFMQRPFQIAGLESAATPILTSILLTAQAATGRGINAFLVRKERKAFGLRNIIEGIPNDEPVVLIDDFTSPQHITTWNAIRAIIAEKLELYGAGFVVVYKGRWTDVPRKLETSYGDIMIDTIFTLDDFDLTLAEYGKKR